MRAVSSAWFLLLLALALPGLALIAGLPHHPRILGVLNDAAHVPIFGTLAIIIHRILERQTHLAPRTVLIVSFLTAIAVGIVVELVQPLIGREGELKDVWSDALGAAAGMALLEFRKPGSRLVAFATLVIAAAAAAWPIAEAGFAYLERHRQAPALLEASSRSDWYFIWTHGFRTTMTLLPAIWQRAGDPASIRIQIEDDPWRVLTLTEPIPDWRPYDRLMVDLTNPGPNPLRITLRIHDRSHTKEHTDRFNRRINVPAQTRMVIDIPLTEVAAAPVGRQMELAHIVGVMLFVSGREELAGRDFYVTRIWLEPDAH